MRTEKPPPPPSENEVGTRRARREASRRVQCSEKSVAREGKSRVSSILFSLLWPFEIVITHYNSSTSASKVSVCSSAKVTVEGIQFQQKQNQQHLLKGSSASEFPASLLKRQKEMEKTTNEPKRNELLESFEADKTVDNTGNTHTQNCKDSTAAALVKDEQNESQNELPLT